jgi:hypothetical protein
VPWRDTVGVGFGEAGTQDGNLLCRLSSAVSALDSEPSRMAVLAVDITALQSLPVTPSVGKRSRSG